MSACYKADIQQVHGLRQKIRISSINGQLAKAAQEGDFDNIEQLIYANADPNATDTGFPSGCTPLIIASTAGHLRVVSSLLNAKAEPDKQDGASNTALCAASAKNHQRVALQLLQKRADPNLRDGHGIAPMEHAIMREHNFIVELLIAKKANVRAQTKNGQSLLSLACQSGNIHIASHLLHANANADINKIDRGGGSPLRNAARYNHYGLALLLIKSGARAHLCNGQISNLSEDMFNLLRHHSQEQTSYYLSDEDVDNDGENNTPKNSSTEDVKKNDRCPLL